MSAKIRTIRANSRDGGEVYELLVLAHSMAGSLAQGIGAWGDRWQLHSTYTDMERQSFLTAWTNSIIEIEARSSMGEHWYELRACVKEDGDE
jgi:hypothetical protein